MANELLYEKGIRFAVRCVSLYKTMAETRGEYVMSKQMLRSGTSIGANIHEAQYAQGKANFVSKLQIALKEANETSYWLLLLVRTDTISQAEYDRLENLCREIRITLIASVNTAKGTSK